MDQFSPAQAEEIEKYVQIEIDKRTNLILKTFDLNYDTTPLISGFDPNKTGWDLNNAVCNLRASVLAYRDWDYIKMELEKCEGAEIKFFENDKNGPLGNTHTQAFGISFDGAIIIAFRGTETKTLKGQVRDLITDAKIDQKDFYGQGKVHYGFLKALDSIWGQIHDFLDEHDKDKNKKIWFTGHSLGAAVATLATARILFDPKENSRSIGGLYTIGQPRTGNKKFAAKFDEKMKDRTIRIAKNNDLITMVPFGFGYTHIGGFHYFKDDGTYQHEFSDFSQRLDKLKGLLTYAFQVSLKSIMSRTIGYKMTSPSLVEDHDKENYLASVKEERDRVAEENVMKKVST